MTAQRNRALLDVLGRASRPLSGEELGSLLHVSSRTVRNYVRELNVDEELVSTSHHGYGLTAAGRTAVGTAPKERSRGYDTPQRRLGYLCRTLPQSNEPVGFHELADHLCVSESTLKTSTTPNTAWPGCWNKVPWRTASTASSPLTGRSAG